VFTSNFSFEVKVILTNVNVNNMRINSKGILVFIFSDFI